MDAGDFLKTLSLADTLTVVDDSMSRANSPTDGIICSPDTIDLYYFR